jgi:hypothetical protein
MKYSKKEYSFIKFERSHLKNKKYNAVLARKLPSGKTREVRVPFGDTKYQQYKDSTGLGLYSHLDHGDPARRAAYRLRHNKDRDPENYTAGNYSLKYLW